MIVKLPPSDELVRLDASSEEMALLIIKPPNSNQVIRLVKTGVDLFRFPNLKWDQARLDAIEDLSELIHALCAKNRPRSIHANQNAAELTELCGGILRKRPQFILEIGTAKGGTLYLWTRLVQPGGMVISIDKPGAVGSVRPLSLAVYRTFGRRRGVEVITLPMDSHHPATRQRLLECLGNRRLDFLFIDGDHSYEGVRDDFHDYFALMAPEGLIALHDIAVTDSNPRIQVGRFWRELCGQGYVTKSIVSQPGLSAGIGIVFNKGANLAEASC